MKQRLDSNDYCYIPSIYPTIFFCDAHRMEIDRVTNRKLLFESLNHRFISFLDHDSHCHNDTLNNGLCP